MKYLRAAAVLLGFAAVLPAASPAAWEMTSYQDFLKAKFTGLALSRDGRVSLAPKLETLFEGEAAVWSIAASPGADGAVYLGTGHKGKLIRVDRAGRAATLWTAGEAEIFAVTVDAAGRNVYAATSPDGRIYRIDAATGAAAEFFDPKARYIWSLAVGRDGALYAGTGDEGRILRVTAPGQGEAYYETGQSHVTALAWDREGRLLAGSEPNGLVYRVTAKDRAFVIHDAALPEIRSIIAAADGSIYVAAMGGSVARQSTPPAGGAAPQPATQSVPVVTTTVTVSEDAQAGIDRPKPAVGSSSSSSSTPAAAPAATALTEYAGVEKSAVYRIRPDLTVDTLWNSKEDNVYDIALGANGSVLIGADNQGRVYELDAARKAKLVAGSRESEVLRVLASPAGALVATGTQGRLLRLGNAGSTSGELESTVHDATAIARWGKLAWSAEGCGGCRLAFRTRSGNSARPDKTWSDWSEPLTDAAGSAVPSPNARYTQWKAEFTGAASASPVLDWVRLAYLPQNAPPSLRSLTVSAQTLSAGSRPAAAAAASATPTYSITVTDTGEAGASPATGTPVQPLVRASSEQLMLSWLAEDPDSDKLIYNVWFRADSQREWKPLKMNLAESLHTVDAEAFADGRYWFRVTVSDRPSNPAPDAREDEIVSAPILIDRTPPVVTAGQAARTAAGGWQGQVEARDALTPLRQCEYSVDGGVWWPLAPADGVIDSPAETFTIRLDALPAGEHVIAVRTYDSANNAGVARFLVGQ